MKTNSLNASLKSQLETTVMNCVMQPVSTLSDYYSRMLERKISPRQTLCLLNAQAAFLFAVFADCSLLLRTLCLVWLVTALLKCRAEL